MAPAVVVTAVLPSVEADMPEESKDNPYLPITLLASLDGEVATCVPLPFQ
jgi:hypothetical protein